MRGVGRGDSSAGDGNYCQGWWSSWIPGTQTVEGENQLPKLSPDLSMCATVQAQREISQSVNDKMLGVVAYTCKSDLQRQRQEYPWVCWSAKPTRQLQAVERQWMVLGTRELRSSSSFHVYLCARAHTHPHTAYELQYTKANLLSSFNQMNPKKQ